MNEIVVGSAFKDCHVVLIFLVHSRVGITCLFPSVKVEVLAPSLAFSVRRDRKLTLHALALWQCTRGEQFSLRCLVCLVSSRPICGDAKLLQNFCCSEFCCESEEVTSLRISKRNLLTSFSSRFPSESSREWTLALREMQNYTDWVSSILWWFFLCCSTSCLIIFLSCTTCLCSWVSSLHRASFFFSPNFLSVGSPLGNSTVAEFVALSLSSQSPASVLQETRIF